MKKTLKNTTAVILISLSAVSMASSNINLGSPGTLAPNSTVTIPLSKLIPNAYYNLNCTITSSSSGVYIKASGGQYSQFTIYYLNDTSLPQGQGELNSGNNTFKVTNIAYDPNNNSTISIQNLDHDNSATVTNCSADAVSN